MARKNSKVGQEKIGDRIVIYGLGKEGEEEGSC